MQYESNLLLVLNSLTGVLFFSMNEICFDTIGMAVTLDKNVHTLTILCFQSINVKLLVIYYDSILDEIQS